MKRIAITAALGMVTISGVVAEAKFNKLDIEITRLVDSDTYVANIELLPGLWQNVKIRVRGIDTPEKYRPSKKCKKHERALSLKATAVATLAIGTATRVYVTDIGLGKYAGRFVGTVYLVDTTGGEKNIASLLIKAGLAVPYFGGKKVQDWCKCDLVMGCMPRKKITARLGGRLASSGQPSK